MSSKLLSKIDALPLVKILRILAVASFVFSLVGIIISLQSYPASFSTGKGQTISFIWVVFHQTTQSLYAPLILLALAEIIKLRKIEN